MSEKKQNPTETILFEGTDKLIIQAKEILMNDTVKSDEALNEIVETYKSIIYSDIKDLSAYNFIVDGAKKIKKIRTGIEKRRKELTEPALKFQRDVKAEADRMIEVLKPIEQHLLEQKQSFDDAVEAEKKKLFNERCVQLKENHFQIIGGSYQCGFINLNSDQISTITDEEFEFYIKQGIKEGERIQAEKERKEAEANELKMMREELAKERAELARERAEIAAQKAALDETYNKTEKPKIVECKIVKTENDLGEQKPVDDIETKTTELVEAQEKMVEAFDLEVQPVINVGFEQFRKSLIALVTDETVKLSRKGLIEWANLQTFNS